MDDRTDDFRDPSYEVDAFFPDDLVGYEGPRVIHFVLLPEVRQS
jgi:hypothetical protein